MSDLGLCNRLFQICVGGSSPNNLECQKNMIGFGEGCDLVKVYVTFIVRY